MSNISTDILRIIATTQTWVKDYAVVAALTRNANTPVALPTKPARPAERLDLRLLSNVADRPRISARKKLALDTQ